MIYLLWAILPAVIHEAAHFVAALLTGNKLKFKFGFGKLGPIPIPRYTWDKPSTTKEKLRFICQAGFVAELALVPFLPWQYQAVALVHFAVYPWYSGEFSDFNDY